MSKQAVTFDSTEGTASFGLDNEAFHRPEGVNLLSLSDDAGGIRVGVEGERVFARYYRTDNGRAEVATSVPARDPGADHRVTVTWDEDRGIELYLDGVSKGTASV